MKEETIKLTKKELEGIKDEAFGVGYDAGYNAGIENKNSTEKGINYNG